MKTPYQIQYEAFASAGGLYNEGHAKLYAELADAMIEDGSFSIVYEGVAHACYTPITVDAAPHLKCYVLAPWPCCLSIKERVMQQGSWPKLKNNLMLMSSLLWESSTTMLIATTLLTKSYRL